MHTVGYGISSYPYHATCCRVAGLQCIVLVCCIGQIESGETINLSNGIYTPNIGFRLTRGWWRAVPMHYRSSRRMSVSTVVVMSPKGCLSRALIGLTVIVICYQPLFTARRNARIAIAVLAITIPPVCPSATRRYCVKTTVRSTVQFALSDSKMCLVL